MVKVSSLAYGDVQTSDHPNIYNTFTVKDYTNRLARFFKKDPFCSFWGVRMTFHRLLVGLQV